MAWGRRAPRVLGRGPVQGHASASRTGRDGRWFVGILLVVLILAAFSFVLLPGSSGLRWTLLSLVLIIVGVAVFLSLYRSGARMPRLQPTREPERSKEGRLSRLNEVLERADRGMRFSQASVAGRVRKAFLDRLKSERNLGEDELAALLIRPDLREFLDDPVIHAFLEDTAPAEEGRPELSMPDPTTFRFARGRGYTQGLARVLRAMEGWR